MLEEEKKGKRIKELEQQIEKMKSDVISERDKAKRLEDVITYTVLNNILAKWEIKEKIVNLTPTDKDKRIEELEVQIERMKCCGNCDWSNYLPNGNCLDCDGKKNWKLKEIKEND